MVFTIFSKLFMLMLVFMATLLLVLPLVDARGFSFTEHTKKWELITLTLFHFEEIVYGDHAFVVDIGTVFVLENFRHQPFFV